MQAARRTHRTALGCTLGSSLCFNVTNIEYYIHIYTHTHTFEYYNIYIYTHTYIYIYRNINVDIFKVHPCVFTFIQTHASRWRCQGVASRDVYKKHIKKMHSSRWRCQGVASRDV
jgi:hypothetical protein